MRFCTSVQFFCISVVLPLSFSFTALVYTMTIIELILQPVFQDNAAVDGGNGSGANSDTVQSSSQTRCPSWHPTNSIKVC